MAIKFNSDIPGPRSDATLAGRVETARPNTKEGAPKGVATDAVHLTSEVVTLGRVQESLAEVPVVDEARVGAVRDAIARGEYQIDADRIAEKMLALEALL